MVDRFMFRGIEIQFRFDVVSFTLFFLSLSFVDPSASNGIVVVPHFLFFFFFFFPFFK